jgi:UDP-N-acetyl-D-mannosaminuronic acid dehydrogenase
MSEIAVLGLGYIGLPTSIVLANSGHKVYGYDVNSEVIKKLQSGKIHIVESNLQDEFEKAIKNKSLIIDNRLRTCGVYIIAVPTPYVIINEQKKADLNFVISASKKIAEKIKKDDLVILESTVPPGTTKLVQEIISSNSNVLADEFHTVHCPERVLPGRILYELKNNDRIIGSSSIKSAEIAKELYKSFVKGGKIFITDDVTAELSKLVENTYRDVNIAFANELSMICDEANLDVFELISLANKHPRVNILNPGVGVGGHCLAVDPWFINESFPKLSNLIKQSRQTNEMKPYWVSSIVEKKVNYSKSKRIIILGLSYKPNIDDLRESPSIILAKDLIDKGYNVLAVEPYISDDNLKGIRNISLEESIKLGDLFVLTLAHNKFKKNLDKLINLNILDCVGLLRKEF